MARDQNWILKFKLTYFIPGNLAPWEENTQQVFNCDLSWADPEGGWGEGGGGAGGPDTPLKNHKNIRFLSNTGPDPLKNHKATKPSSARQRNAI